MQNNTSSLNDEIDCYKLCPWKYVIIFDTLLLVNVILMGTLFSTNSISKSSKLCNLDKSYMKEIYVTLNELNLGPFSDYAKKYENKILLILKH